MTPAPHLVFLQDLKSVLREREGKDEPNLTWDRDAEIKKQTKKDPVRKKREFGV